MANIVDIQIVEDNLRDVVALINVVADGSGTLNQQILDPATFSVPCAEYRLMAIRCNATFSQFTTLSWDATANKTIVVFGGPTLTEHDFSEIGGLPNYAGAGKTGALWIYSNLTLASQRLTIYLKLLKVGV